jgi:hypothetical protein
VKKSVKKIEKMKKQDGTPVEGVAEDAKWL